MIKLVLTRSRTLLLESYLTHYLALTSIPFSEIEAWLVPAAAARLAEGIPEPEKQVLLSMIRKRLSE